MIGDGQDPPRKIELLGPNMKKGLFARAAHFPGHSGEGCDPPAVFPHFDGADGGEFLKAGLQFSSEFHDLDYK
jgi:hypothetical protein